MNFLKKYKDITVYVVTILFSLAFIIGGYALVKPDASQLGASAEEMTYAAKVTRIDNVEDTSYSLGGGHDIAARNIVFTAEITSVGTLKGIPVTATQGIDGMLTVNPKEVEVGDKVIVTYLDMSDGTMEWYFSDYYRSNILIYLCIAFFILLLIFGMKKGVNTILSLTFTVLAVFFVFVPSILSGHNIYLWSIIISLFVIFMTLLLVNGANKKTLCAICGNIGGLAVAGILVVALDSVLNLTGVVDENSLYLMMMNQDSPLDLKAIIFAGIIIGALGATMDVAMSIASALHELAENMDNRSFKTMLKSGFNIGRDAMSTMTNTLVLAYIGTSLAVVLLIVGNNGSLMSIFNREMIVVEVVRAIVGSIGILCAIPITSVLSAYLYNRKRG